MHSTHVPHIFHKVERSGTKRKISGNKLLRDTRALTKPKEKEKNDDDDDSYDGQINLHACVQWVGLFKNVVNLLT